MGAEAWGDAYEAPVERNAQNIKSGAVLYVSAGQVAGGVNRDSA